MCGSGNGIQLELNETLANAMTTALAMTIITQYTSKIHQVKQILACVQGVPYPVFFPKSDLVAITIINKYLLVRRMEQATYSTIMAELKLLSNNLVNNGIGRLPWEWLTPKAWYFSKHIEIYSWLKLFWL